MNIEHIRKPHLLSVYSAFSSNAPFLSFLSPEPFTSSCLLSLLNILLAITEGFVVQAHALLGKASYCMVYEPSHLRDYNVVHMHEDQLKVCVYGMVMIINQPQHRGGALSARQPSVITVRVVWSILVLLSSLVHCSRKSHSFVSRSFK